MSEQNEDRENAALKTLRDQYGVKIVCPQCHGDGKRAYQRHRDCRECEGSGYLWAVRFTERGAIYEEALHAVECDIL